MLRSLASLLVTSAGIGLLSASAQAFQLTGDSCAAPRAISGTGVFAFDTTGATTSPETGGGCDASIIIMEDRWDVWAAPETGLATFSLCGTASFDATLVVYEGSGCPSTPALACSLDACGLDPSVTIPVFGGRRYLIRIGGHFVGGSGPGSYSLTLAPGLWDRRLGPLSITPASTPGTYDISVPMELTLTGPIAAGTNLSASIDLYVDGNLVAGLTQDLLIISGGSHCGTGGVGCSGSCPAPSECHVLQLGAEYGQADNGGCSCHGIAGIFGVGALALAPGAQVHAELSPMPSALPEIATTNDFTPPAVVEGVGLPFCSGDGSGTPCPCGNNGVAGRGCANSIDPSGAQLIGWGQASISADTLVLHGSGMPNSSALYFQGTSQLSGGQGVAFGDGLRCAGGTVIRLATTTNVGGTSLYPGGGDPAISVQGLVAAPGTRTYQVWYRNAAAFCTPSTFNLTNGTSVFWAP